MTDAGFVFAGWGIVAATVGGYWLVLVLRTRRAERSRP